MLPQRNIQHLNNQNNDRDKFFFIFTPSSVDIECCCCFSLRTGVKLISFVFAIISGFTLYSITQALSNFMIIMLLIFNVLFFIIAISLYISTNSYEYSHAYIAYVIFKIIILFNAIEDICGIVMLYFGLIDSPISFPVILNYFPFVILGFTLVCIISIWIEIYLLWLIYSYMIHLKHNRLKVIFGQEVVVDYLQEDLAQPLLIN